MTSAAALAAARTSIPKSKAIKKSNKLVVNKVGIQQKGKPRSTSQVKSKVVLIKKGAQSRVKSKKKTLSAKKVSKEPSKNIFERRVTRSKNEKVRVTPAGKGRTQKGSGKGHSKMYLVKSYY